MRRLRRSGRDVWLAMDLSPRALAVSMGDIIRADVRQATTVPGRDANGNRQWPLSVLLYHYGDYQMPMGVIDILLAEPKEYMLGESLDLIVYLINATPACPVFALWHLTGRLLQLGQFPEVDIPADRDTVAFPSNPNNQHWFLLSAYKSTRSISVWDSLPG